MDEVKPNTLAEPTVLDWFKSLLRGRPIPIPRHEDPPAQTTSAVLHETATAPQTALPLMTEGDLAVPRLRGAHLRVPLAVLLSLIAQFGLERRTGTLSVSLGLYLLAAVLVGWAFWAGDISVTPAKDMTERRFVAGIRPRPLAVAGVLSVLTFLASRGNEFSTLTVTAWLGSLVAILAAFWQGELPFPRVLRWLKQPRLSLSLDGLGILSIVVGAVALYFRTTHFSTVPLEMWSDQAEKLLDVMDVLAGKHSIYFPRNTGREALHFYMAALTYRVFGTGFSFETLKIGTVLAGILTIPFIYLVAREYGGRGTAVAAAFLAGVGSWPNVISRMGLRYPLYPLFVAPAFYFLLRGLRLRSRNSLLLCGLAIGVGLHGYSPARVIPLAIVFAGALYLLHDQSRGQRAKTIAWLLAAFVVALIILVPLLRVALEMPELFLSRMLTRMGPAERPLPGPPLPILIRNIWNALRMFAWDNGEIWIISIPHRPALDWVTAALFNLGAVILFLRYLRQKNWQDLFLLLSIPILMLPSILSLAFPNENPSPNRASGAVIPVFVLAGVALAAIPEWARTVWRRRSVTWTVLGGTVLLSLLVAFNNYRLTFNEFGPHHRNVSWNTTEVTSAIRWFGQSVGTAETVHIVGYPYWLDTRIVALLRGGPYIDPAIWPDQLELLLPETRAQLFVYKPEDEVARDRLHALFPTGTTWRWTSAVEGRDFMLYLVPPVLEAEEALIEEPVP